MDTEIFCCAVGFMQANCYLVKSGENAEAFVVDPGFYCEEIEKMLNTSGVNQLKYILITHGHFDHIIGIKKLQEKFGGKIVIHEKDSDCFVNPVVSLLANHDLPCDLPEKADIIVRDGDELPFGGKMIKVIHTPGHTSGGVCYLFENRIFTGDTLFKGSIGRSDFPGGDYETLISSIARLASIKENHTVLPGHGAKTTLEEERWSNPYFSLAQNL